MNVLSLNGEWLLSAAEKNISVPAIVPGCVHTDLLNANIISDPFYRDNEFKDMWVCELDVSYEREFAVPESYFLKERIMLEMDGLDTFASIYINNRFVAATKNMHRRYAFDVKDFLLEGKNNKIRVDFASAARYGKENTEKNNGFGAGDTSLPGSEQVRKAMYQWGWDWGPKIPTAGIWRDIRLVAYEVAKITDVIVNQSFDGGNVELTISVETDNPSGRYVDCCVDIIDPEGNVIKTLKDKTADNSIIYTIINNPEIWYPVGFGEHPLYTISVKLLAGNNIADQKELKIGFRDLEIVQEKDHWGRSFYIRVNGIPVFAKGADYIPCDQFPSRLTEADYKKILESCVEANMNCLRVWGGGIYESDVFYNLCDEMGILVWQDFMYACAHYPMTPEMIEEYAIEAEDNIKRLRHHACISLWCGNNEMEWFLSGGWPSNGDNQVHKDEFERLFYHLIADICAREDSSRTYIPASPFSEKIFEDPNGEGSGDAHYWDVWHGRKPFPEYRKHYFRFMSEFGFQSLPSCETLKSVTRPEDRVMFSRIMDSHQKNPTGNEAIMFYLGKSYKLPKDFESLIYISQILHGDAMRYGVEHWRRNRNDFRCMGTLYWQLNDCWQVASWASLEYGGRWKACHYMAKEFYKPILLSIEETESNASIYITNDTTSKFAGDIEYSVWNTDGVKLFSEIIGTEVNPCSAKMITAVDMSQYLAGDGKYNVFFAAKLLNSDDVEKSAFFVPAKYMELKKADVKISHDDKNLIIETDKPIFYSQISVPDYGVRFDHNFFTMLPENVYNLEIRDFDGLSIAQIAEKARVISVVDTY